MLLWERNISHGLSSLWRHRAASPCPNPPVIYNLPKPAVYLKTLNRVLKWSVFLKWLIHIQPTKKFLPAKQSTRTWDSRVPPKSTGIIQSAKCLHSLIIVDRLNKRQKKRGGGGLLGRAMVLAIACLLSRRQKRCSKVQTLRVLEGWGSQISRQSAHEIAKVARPRRCRLYSAGYMPGTHFC
jgi:hypothetical protein